MKVIIAGSREFSDFPLLYSKCDEILESHTDIEIVSGTAKGADKLGEHYASLKGYSVTQFPADWEKHYRKAGFIRNEQMANYGEMLIAFWDGESKGTKHMIDLAKSKGLETHVIIFNLSE